MMIGMSDTAPTTSSLMGKLRSSFATTGTLAISSGDGSNSPVVPVAQPTVSQQSIPVQPALEAQSPLSTSSTPSTADKLTTLEQILHEVEQQVVVEQQAQINPVVTPTMSAPSKEAFVPATSQLVTEGATATNVVEMAASLQPVEYEPAPEIPPEVSEYLSHVENHAQGEPQEIVIAEAQQQVPLATTYPKQTVIVLPITPDVEQQGKKKGPFNSVRWLVEWSYKLMKMFSGKIIYREVEV
jgi:hypothetical protein